MSKQSKELLARFAVWRADPAAWVGDVLINPESGKPFVLYKEEIEFLRRAFTLTSEGKLPWPEILFSAGKSQARRHWVRWQCFMSLSS